MRPKGDFLDPITLPDGLHVVFMQAIPLYKSEVERKAEVGADALVAEWERQELPFWDPDRSDPLRADSS